MNRFFLTGTIVIFAFGLTSCDLVMYDEDALATAQRADDFELLELTEYEEWEYRDDEDELARPTGFYPDAVGETDGFLVHQDDRGLIVWRINGGEIYSDISIGLPPPSVHTDWEAWIVPIDGSIPNPLGYRPILMIATWGPERQVSVHAVGYNPLTDSVESGPIDLLGYVQTTDPSVIEVLSINVVGYGPSSTLGGGGVFSTTAGSELQVLVRSDPTFGGRVKELFYQGSGVDYVDWALGDPSALALVGGAGKNEFFLPERSDGDTPLGIRYASDRASLTGALSFADGDYSDAPRSVYTWPTFGVLQSASLSTWSGRIATIGYDGTLRTARSGEFAFVTNLGDTPGVSVEDNGTLWYAGRFPDGTGELAPMVDLYSQVNLVRTLSDTIITIAIYR